VHEAEDVYEHDLVEDVVRVVLYAEAEDRRDLLDGKYRHDVEQETARTTHVAASRLAQAVNEIAVLVVMTDVEIDHDLRRTSINQSLIKTR